METQFAHINIVSHDWRRLARFYIEVFGCEETPPPRDIREDWLAIGSGVPGARLVGAHLRLPGFGPDGPTLEIYEYTKSLDRPTPVAANRLGYGHLAFAVDDVEAVLRDLVDHGGAELGRIVTAEVPGKGRITWVYATDPEGNIIELQRWW